MMVAAAMIVANRLIQTLATISNQKDCERWSMREHIKVLPALISALPKTDFDY